jgi:hypothetical protein
MNSERLQLLARFESHGLAGRDADFLAGARVPANACLSRANVKHAEAAQFDSLPLAESALHGFEDRFDGLFGLGSAYACFVHYRVHNIQLNHTSLLLFDGSLC